MCVCVRVRGVCACMSVCVSVCVCVCVCVCVSECVRWCSVAWCGVHAVYYFVVASFDLLINFFFDWYLFYCLMQSIVHPQLFIPLLLLSLIPYNSCNPFRWSFLNSLLSSCPSFTCTFIHTIIHSLICSFLPPNIAPLHPSSLILAIQYFLWPTVHSLHI